MDEEEKREIEVVTVVTSLCFHTVNVTQKTGVYDNLKCSTVAVVSTRMGPSVCQVNIPRCLTVYLSLDNESRENTDLPVSM